jgi:hypothetical protein
MVTVVRGVPETDPDGAELGSSQHPGEGSVLAIGLILLPAWRCLLGVVDIFYCWYTLVRGTRFHAQ